MDGQRPEECTTCEATVTTDWMTSSAQILDLIALVPVLGSQEPEVDLALAHTPSSLYNRSVVSVA